VDCLRLKSIRGLLCHSNGYSCFTNAFRDWLGSSWLFRGVQRYDFVWVHLWAQPRLEIGVVSTCAADTVRAVVPLHPITYGLGLRAVPYVIWQALQ
jgi:hypothetical protein